MKKHVPNPNFGKGTFRRRILLTGLSDRVVAELEDCNHGFRSVVFHDGNTITDIQAEALRVPMSTCPGAVEPIKQLIGSPLSEAAKNVTAFANPRANCTHLFDLSALAIAHALRGETTRQYDVVIPDAANGTGAAAVERDGKVIHDWVIEAHTIQQPEPLRDKPVMRGFHQWATKAFSDDQLEAALVLQKGFFVSLARIYDMDATAGALATDDTAMQGVCYSYSSPAVNEAYRLKDVVRDFSDCPDQLLKFE